MFAISPFVYQMFAVIDKHFLPVTTRRKGPKPKCLPCLPYIGLPGNLWQTWQTLLKHPDKAHNHAEKVFIVRWQTMANIFKNPGNIPQPCGKSVCQMMMSSNREDWDTNGKPIWYT